MSRNGRAIRAIIISILTLTVASFVSARGGRESAKDAVAMVNGIAIPRAFLDREIGRIEQQMTQDGYVPGEDDAEDIRSGALESLVSMELLYQRSQERGFTVTESRVDIEISMLQGNFEDAEGYKQALEQMQLTESQLRTEIERNMAVQDFIDSEFRRNATISDEELRDFYDTNPEMFSDGLQVRARHIIITVAQDATDEQKQAAREKIEGIRQQIDQGADFGELAKEYSEGPSGAQGGDLGYFGRGQMVEPFETAAFSLPIGQVSDIVITQYGYHLIQVIDKTTSEIIPFDEIQEQLRDYLLENKVLEQIAEHIDELRSAAEIETY